MTDGLKFGHYRVAGKLRRSADGDPCECLVGFLIAFIEKSRQLGDLPSQCQASQDGLRNRPKALIDMLRIGLVVIR
jgi:hypothetical protein